MADESKEVIEVRGISDAEDFDDLYDILNAKGTLVSEDREYTPQQLKSAIELVRDFQMPPNAITRTDGLRDKVLEFLKDKK